ncbi:MAG TPA: N-6 DNA methylase [Ktedonobacteraceae bacterium]|jgi:hypothetical protein
MERDSSPKDQAKIVQPALALAPHRNQQLFSDYYLNALLPARPEWQELAVEAEPVLRDLQALFAGYTPTEREAQTEDDWIKPVLRCLGHTFEVQPSLDTPDGTKMPDYVFYRDRATLVANKRQRLNELVLLNRAMAIGDAKHWDRPLDISLKRAGGDVFTNKNPSYQIAFYIQHSGLEWGILTNGRVWRLYHKETAHKLDRFYEVDLPALLAAGSAEDFLYFYAFFRRQAFEPGPLGLETIRNASVDFARGVSDSLKAQVYEALRHVAQGFLDYRPNQLHPDQETLQEIYDNALIVLYRLLFILYAEARELLPVQESAEYRECYSLASLKKQVRSNLAGNNTLLPTTSILWAQLRALFGMIDEGCAQLQVSAFHGGLFDPARHPFLERYMVGDRHLQQAIDRLARVDRHFVDYRDLAERHLGTIYEGLLEFHLVSLPAAVDGWTIELRASSGERKASGSYYTPAYIVKYMVEETLGPVLRQAVAGAATDAEKIQAVLNLKVLDPAMGSGHFPVEATEYIARFLVEQLEQPVQSDLRGETELLYWKRRVAQSCIYGVDLNPLAVELAKLSLWLATVARDRPLSFLDHHLRCGNALAGASLADLRSGTVGAKKLPRRRAQAALAIEAEQPALFDEESLRQAMNSAVDLMWQIETSPAQHVREVRQQEQTYQDLRRQLVDRYAGLANLASATHFGVSIDHTYWKPLADYATGRVGIAPAQFDTWLDAASAAAGTYRFFHWDLEFPEIFFDRHGLPRGSAGGFDVVIGNPPYVRQEELATFKPYFAAAYPETYDGVADLYVYFAQQGLRLTRAGGRMAYIVTNKWMRAGYGQSLRAFIAGQRALERIIDFGHAPIFEAADVFPCILILEKPDDRGESAQPDGHPVQVLSFPRAELSKIIGQQEGLGRYVQAHSHALPRSHFSRVSWNLETFVVEELLARIQRVGVPLAEFAGVKPYRGVLTGRNEAFLIDTPTRERLVREDPRCAEILKPVLRGQDIKRWVPAWAGLWMIFARRGIDIEAYPAVKQHLLQFRTQLAPRPEDWSEEHWPGRKPGSYRWYEIQDAVDYWPLFEQPKIITQDLATYSWFGFDDRGFYPVNTCYIWSTSDLYLLGWLCSPLAWWLCHRLLQRGINDTLRMFGEQTQLLPIVPPTEAIRSEVEQVVTGLIAITRTQRQVWQSLVDWLRVEFEIQEPGKRLERVTDLDLDTFVREVRRRRLSRAGRPTPTTFRALQEGYGEFVVPLQQGRTEVLALERRLNDLVNTAYGLTPEEIALLWKTAPPRMPLTMPQSEHRDLSSDVR